MLINTIIIVIRETLEAGILITLLLTISDRYQLGYRWLYLALAIGVSGAVIYALNLGHISTWFDYVGQEVVNASLQYAIYILLVLICITRQRLPRYLAAFTGAAVALAIVREGGELVIFYSGFLQNKQNLTAGITGGFIGLTIGISVGLLLFYTLASLATSKSIKIQNILLCLVAGGMVLQATQLLIQADWIPSLPPLWNSTRLIPEPSIVGQVAYAIFGYEATPSVIEVIFYVVAIMIIPGLKFALSRSAFGDRPAANKALIKP